MENPPLPPELPLQRRLRRYGVLLLLLATFLPYHGCRAHPSHYEPGRSPKGSYDLEHSGALPAAYLEWVLRDKVLGLPYEKEEALFRQENAPTDDYPGAALFFAPPVWALALLLAHRGGRARRAAGVLCALALLASLVAIGIAVFQDGFDGVGPPWMETPEAVALLAGAILLAGARPRGRRRLDDVEAAVSGHALLGIGVALYWPMYRYLEWTLVDGFQWGPVMASLWQNYRLGFWVALAGLGLTAAPLYFSGPLRGRLYHRILPWHSPSSIPTPTSTSTGSTTTGTPSSTGPGPPASSPS